MRGRAVALAAGLAAFYGAAFAALTYPRIRQLSSHFWADHGDGLENVWNLRSFATYLAAQPGTSAYIEVAEPPLPAGIALYYQTVHEKPMAFGHRSRKTAAALAGARRLRELTRTGSYRELHCRYGFRWLLADDRLGLDAPAKGVELWEAGRTGRIYDLEPRFGPCVPAP